MYSKWWFFSLYSSCTCSTSTLDLSICGPSLVLDYDWNIQEDLWGSNHFPVILTSNAAKEDTAPNRWNFDIAGWWSFQAQCFSELTEEVVMPAEDPAGQFTGLIKAAGKAVPKVRFSRLPKVPWYKDSCKKAIKERKKAQQVFFLIQHWVMFKKNKKTFKSQGSPCC